MLTPWKKSYDQSATAAAKSLQSCLTLCDPIDGSPPGSPVPGILQARTLEWVAISFSKAWKWREKWREKWSEGKRESEVAQLCPTLSDPMDCSLSGSSIHGIFQARVLKGGAIAFSDLILISSNIHTHTVCNLLFQDILELYTNSWRYFLLFLRAA